MAEGRQPGYRQCVYFLAILVFVGTNLISLFIFNLSPHIHDEAAYDFQAKVFLLGRLYVQSPCAKEFVDFPHVINNGRWYSQYPPGFPALLAAGYLLKAPWIINPSFAALTVILIFFLGKELFNEKAGFLAALFTSLSYWFLILSSTMMSHTPHLFFCTLFLLFYFKSLGHPSVKNGLISGFGFFMAFLIRPYESVLYAIPPAVYFLFKFIKEPKKYLKVTFVFAFMALFSLIALLAYNYGTTGHPLKMGYIEKYGPDHNLGFGKKGYTGVPHTFLRGAEYAWKNLVQLHLHLFGWAISSFLGLIIYLFFLTKRYWHAKSRTLEFLLLFIILSTFAGLLFYWGAFPILGARMYFQLFSILALLTAAGIIELSELIRKHGAPRLIMKMGLPLILIIFTTYSVFVRLPLFARQSFESYIPDLAYPDFLSFNQKFKETIKALGIDEAIVLLKPLYLPRRFFPDSGWTAGFIQNDPQLKKRIIFGLYKPTYLNGLFSCYPDKKVYLFLCTVKEAMLFELKTENHELKISPPLTSSESKLKIKLVSNLNEYFKPYSTEFSEFLKTFNNISPLDFDLELLTKLAAHEELQGNYEQASMYYEAALQLEPYPEHRQDLYRKLCVCYFKAGNVSLAKRIMENIYQTPEPIVNNIIPERGL
jgi:4-amino-4-deoxy-L-arabinose transferase-like glycosyltransferase